MKKAILDTSFILTAVRQKIDFFYDLKTTGFKILIPDIVLREIETISKSNKNSSRRENAKLTMKVIKKGKYEIVVVNKGNDARKFELEVE